jgi:hypothetical protein
MDNNLVPKNPNKKFYCEKCDYFTCNLKDYKKHLSTAKHTRITNDNNKIPKNPQVFICECGSEYKYSSGLSKHRKKCTYMITQNVIETVKKDDGQLDLYKQLLPLMKEMIVDIIPVLQPNTNTVNNTNTTNNNQIYNINMFLNEECKDAMNMSEFIESIQLTLDDMTKIGTEGQTAGVTNILIDKLNQLDIVKRPVHCSDAKKETIYVKDENKWEQEKYGKPKMKKALDKLMKKSIEAMPCMENDPDEYIKTISEVLKDPREDKKIISGVAKEMMI